MKMRNQLLSLLRTPIFSVPLVYFLLLLSFCLALGTILAGNTPFWYDNARDLLSGWENLSKPTLIGPTSGIPGIFYGPYWIWLLSIAEVISKNPRFVAIIVGIIPYYVLFPFILLRFTPLFDRNTRLLLLLLFLFNTGFGYATSMWNPYIAPVLFLSLVYLITFPERTKQIPQFLQFLSIGFTLGLLINFHISFGIGVGVGTVLYLVGRSIQQLRIKKYSLLRKLFGVLTTFLLFAFGLVCSFIPFLLFEFKHGFNQIQTAAAAFTKYGAVVSQQGLGKSEIIDYFFGRSAELFHMNHNLMYLLEFSVALVILYLVLKKKIQVTSQEMKVLFLLFCVSVGILGIYLTAKNPVWDYHFIGVEIIFLLLIGIACNKSILIRNMLFIWITCYSLFWSSTFLFSFNENLHHDQSLFSKEYMVDTIANDARHGDYTVYAYSPSIYTYEYTYLFRQRYQKDVPYDPGKIQTGAATVYLLIPAVTKDIRSDFIHFRTPDSLYTTQKNWKLPGGTEIIKREHRELN